MKVLIIFLGLLALDVCFMSYQGDIEKFVRQQAMLKFMAEECAASAATFLDTEKFAEGDIVFDYVEGKRYTEEFIEFTKEKVGWEGTVSFDLVYEDDLQGYQMENVEENPAVIAHLTLEAEDLFRLPFLTLTKMERSTRYQLE